MLANLLIHLGLGLGGLLRLVVPAAAIAHEVNHHVLAKFHPIIDGKLHGKDHRLWVVAIHVKDGRLNHLCDFRAVLRGPGVFLVACGEAHLVIDDEVIVPPVR